MSLSGGEQRTLSCIADGLAASDPKLASMLRVFNRVNSNEQMPARRRASRSQQQESGGSRRTRKRARKPRLWRPSGKAAWLALTIGILISITLITMMIVLSNTGHGTDGRWRCPQFWATTCTKP